MDRDPERFWDPYVAGVALGIVLLATFLTMGWGLGAASASYRVGVWILNVVAPAHVQNVPPMAGMVAARHPLNDWIILEVIGVLLGGAVAAATSGRLRREVRVGPTFGAGKRIALAVAGGILMGFAAKLARGCTSGQALSGGSLLSVGGWAFMISFFVGGYALAWLPRRQWR